MAVPLLYTIDLGTSEGSQDAVVSKVHQHVIKQQSCNNSTSQDEAAYSCIDTACDVLLIFVIILGQAKCNDLLASSS